VVRLLVELGADRDAKSNDGSTALHRAAFLGHEAVVRLLVELGADRDAKSNDGWTALHRAASRGHEAGLSMVLPPPPPTTLKTSNTFIR